MARFGIWGFVSLALWAGPGGAEPAPLSLDTDDSVFAVVTHKAGLAARLAHNHWVVAEQYDATLAFDPAVPTATRLTLDVPVASLVVDDPAHQQRWQDRILELGLVDQAFGEISASDRAKIDRAMRSRKQLDAERHPRLRAELESVEHTGDGEFPFRLQLRVEIVGQSVVRPVVGRFQVDGERVILEAHGELRFTDFGIEPYSAMLGAVRNDDPFHLFVHLEAPLPAP